MKKILVLSLAVVAAGNTQVFAQAKKKAAAQTGNAPKTTNTTTAAAPAYDAASNGYKVMENGLMYRIVKDVEGTTPKVGDFITIHTYTHVGDSVLFSSRAVNNNEPFEIQVRPPVQPRFDLMDAFQLMSAGDSAIFRVPLDSMIAMGAPALPWMKQGTGMMLDYEVVMLKVKPQAEAFKEKAEKAKSQMQADEKLLTDYLAKNNVKAVKHQSGLYYKITKQGTGDTAKPGQKVFVNYTGKTMDGKTFDSNVDSSFNHVQPFSFVLAQGQVIPGWDIGVGLLKKGAKATFYIPSPLAYGERSPSPAIPANAILIFDVEVTDIQENK